MIGGHVIHNDPPIFVPTIPKNSSNYQIAGTDSFFNKKVIRKPRKNLYSEEALQIALAIFLNNLERTTKAFRWFHVPNGGKRGILTAKKLKAQGVKPGVPDIIILLSGGRSIFLELKAEGGVLSPDQKQFANDLAQFEHPYHLVKGGLPIDINQQVANILRSYGVPS